MWVKVNFLSPLCGPVDCSLLHSSVHGILQARILEWVAISFSRGSSWSRDWTQVYCIVGRCFSSEPPGKHHMWDKILLLSYCVFTGSFHFFMGLSYTLYAFIIMVYLLFTTNSLRIQNILYTVDSPVSSWKIFFFSFPVTYKKCILKKNSVFSFAPSLKLM